MIIFIPFHLPNTLLEQLSLPGLRKLRMQVGKKNLMYNNSSLLSYTLCLGLKEIYIKPTSCSQFRFLAAYFNFKAALFFWFIS